ncbi:MAG: electron transport complex subunit RsxD, partial [Gammaproteobacteria bacterium]|nr:electron transport complex subunit RsxD [Gammaproteobacteria bacterium]
MVVLISFPQELTQWLAPRPLADHLPGLGEALGAILTGSPPAPLSLDAITGATPLDTLKTGIDAGGFVAEIRQAPLFGDYGG